MMFFPFARLVNLEKSISDYYFCLLKKSSIINQLVRTSCQVISMVSLCGLNALITDWHIDKIYYIGKKTVR